MSSALHQESVTEIHTHRHGRWTSIEGHKAPSVCVARHDAIMDIEAFNLNDLDFDLLQSSAICPHCGVPNCICGAEVGLTPASSSTHTEICTSVPTAVPWPEQIFPPFDKTPAFYQTPLTSTQLSDSGTQQRSLLAPRQTIISSGPETKRKEDCACMHDVAMVSEQLDQYPANRLAFNNILTLARRVVQTCERYARCKTCDESLVTILCVAALRRASVCYKQLGAAPQNLFASVEERTFHCRVGTFETDAVLDEETCRAVLKTEVERASKTAVEMGKLLEADGPKRKPTDDVTLIKTAEHDGLAFCLLDCRPFGSCRYTCGRMQDTQIESAVGKRRKTGIEHHICMGDSHPTKSLRRRLISFLIRSATLRMPVSPV